MSAIIRPEGDAPNEAGGTLGQLLYADASRARVPEAEWVALVRSIAARDQAALHALYQRAHRIVYTLALRITGSRETAEELTVDTFHEVWRRAPSYNPQAGTVVAWIMNQARSRSIDRVRFDQRQKRRDPSPHAADAVAESRDAFELQALAQVGEQLRHALGALSAAEREAIETAYYHELSYAEVAERLHEPLGTIKTRIRSGLAKLRAVLRPGGASK